MRVLLINKFLHPVGGSETVFFQEWAWLEAAGHEVIPFGMAHPDNVASPYQSYWAPQVDYDQPTPGQLVSLIWSRAAARQLKALALATRPDVAHLHNVYHQLSPAIIAVLRQLRIPTVLTAHDYKLVCPNYRLYTQGQVCSRCVGSHPWHALRHRCLKSSWSASALAAVETGVHRWLRAYAGIDQFIAPSHFLKTMLQRGGWPAAQITALPHAVPLPPPTTNANPAAILFAGRLVPEKGVAWLLAAARRLPDVPFRIAGTGPLWRAAAPTNVTWLGHLSPAELAAEYAAARAVVAPSLWYELFGMSALEAMSHGCPVIASRIGALPELVSHEETGLLVAPGEVEELAAAIARLWRDADLAAQLGRAAQAHVRAHHDPADHLTRLVQLFRQLRQPTETSL